MRKAVNHLKKSDPVLAAIIERVGPAACNSPSRNFIVWPSPLFISN